MIKNICCFGKLNVCIVQAEPAVEMPSEEVPSGGVSEAALLNLIQVSVSLFISRSFGNLVMKFLYFYGCIYRIRCSISVKRLGEI